MVLKITLVLAVLVAASSGLPRLQRSRLHRIIGGQEANPNEFPYMLSLQLFGAHICGAAIIRGDVVVTAAHCAEAGPANAFSVKAGKHNIRETEASEQTRQISRVTIHPDYQDVSGFANDIAVLRTASPFVFNSNVAPIPTPPAGHTATGNGVIQGWGVIDNENTFPEVLQKAEIPFVTDEDCRSVYGAENFSDNMICAGLPEGGVDGCTGDSGGPIAANDRGFRYLAGISSWGFECAVAGFPGVYTEISHFVDFIEANAG